MGPHDREALPPGVAEMAPGAELLDVLTKFDVNRLSAHDTVIVAAAWERQQAFAAAQQAKAIAALADKPEYGACTVPDEDRGGETVRHRHDRLQPCADELSLRLQWTPGHARGRVMVACDLVKVLPATLEALEAGLVDAYKAKLVADRIRVLEDAQPRRKVEARVLPVAVKKTASQLDRELRAAVIVADPDAAERRRAAAAQRRRVFRPEPVDVGGADAMARMGQEGPAEDLLAFWTALDAAARHTRTQGDPRTLEQLRFDIMCGLGWTALDVGHLGCCNPACVATGERGGHPFGHSHGRAAQVHVTVPYTVFTSARGDGDDEQNPTGGDVPYLHGYGPVTANAARRVATEGTVRRLLTDDANGAVLEYGRTTYTPPRDLADFVIARDVTCRFPTCDRPARDTDLDHKQPWEAGGDTGTSNVWCLHDGHHLDKTHHGFDIEVDRNGVTWWITPANHRYRVEPESVGLVARPSSEHDVDRHATDLPPY